MAQHTPDGRKTARGPVRGVLRAAVTARQSRIGQERVEVVFTIHRGRSSHEVSQEHNATMAAWMGPSGGGPSRFGWKRHVPRGWDRAYQFHC